MLTHISSISLAALIAALLLVIEHYALLPYVRSIWRRDMPVLVRYTLGTLAMNGTLTILNLAVDMDNVESAAAIVIVVTCSGLAVFACYGLDELIARISEWYESFKLEQAK
mgnify:CR=1 FL=1